MSAVTPIHYDARLEDNERRKKLFAGDLFVYSPSVHSLELCELAQELLREAFAPLDPETAQFEMEVEDYAQILAVVKPKFIHHPECKRIIPNLLEDMGHDPELTYFDIPRLRSSTAQGYLTSGIAYAFHPHRDTWYSAPKCQINWWLPVFEFNPGMGMGIYPRYFDQSVDNTSDQHNYYRWNAESRPSAAKHLKSEGRLQPGPLEEVDLSGGIEIVTPVGGLTGFSGVHLHSSMPNNGHRTRFSIDFRVVHEEDVRNHTGAPSVDCRSVGTTLRDFRKLNDLSTLDEEVCASYDTQPLGEGEKLVFEQSAV